MNSTKDRIWIELELNTNNLRACHRRAEMASIILRHLGHPLALEMPSVNLVFYHEDKEKYCLIDSIARSFVYCTDNGFWLELDPIMSKIEGREEE